MGLSLKPAHLKRYKDIIRLLLKYGRSDVFKGAEAEFGDETPPPTARAAAQAEELAADFEAMGPTFIKLGQLLSSRTDLFPPATIEALSRLRDRVEPVDPAGILKTIEDDLGTRVSRVFPEFDLAPLAAASLGQVHRATLRDGREVVVKVQRPDVRRRAMEDLDSLAQIADFLDRHATFAQRYRIKSILEDFRRSMMQELDYRQEANHLVTLADNLASFERIVVPRPLDDLTTSRVLTMQYIHGFKISALPPVDRALLDGTGLAEELFRAYLKQILVDGFVHADPHPGNVFITEDGRLALLDLGMVLRLSAPLQDRLISLLLALAEGRGDEAAEAVLQLVESDETVDRATFSRRVQDIVGRFQGAELQDLDLGRMLVEISRSAVDCGFFLAPEIGMIGQTMLKLDDVGRRLAPDFKAHEAIRKHALKVLRSRVLHSGSVGSLFKSMVEMKDFATHLPGRVNRILDVVADNRLKLEVDAIDETRLMAGLQKIANRITLGLVLAALILGAALLVRVDSPFRLFGYPGLPILLFGAAAAGILALVATILFNDVSGRPKRPRS
jgi:predicted unusual protein kinase regulating ubiquinone biosynthesis (AarF/ABC1/UbiB family)